MERSMFAAGVIIILLVVLSNSSDTRVVQQPSSRTPDPNVVALWHFDEGSGNILHDASMYHNDGQIHNCQWVPGKFGSALHFDGLTSYVVLPNSPSLRPVREFTLEAWISPDTLQFGSSPYGTAGAIVSNLGPYPNGGGYGTALINPGVFQFDDRSPHSVGNFSGKTPIPQTHKFYHVALVYKQVASGDGGNAIVKTYLNGLLTDISVIPAPIQYDNTPNFYIGTNMDGRAVGNIGVREFLGIIDEIRISKVALHPSQFDIPHGKSTMANENKTGGSNDIFSVGLAPQQSRIVLNGKVGIINTGKSGPSQSRLRFKGIFGLTRESGGPFEEDSIAVTTGDDFFVQVASGLYYEVFVKRESRQGVTLKFSRMLKRK